MPAPDVLPGFADVLDAAARIAPHAHVTPVLRSRSLDEAAGAHLHFKAEHLQRVGAFKFRGACNAVWSQADEVAARGVATHSSGNHGAALALAARVRGIPCHVVVPEGAVQAKLAAIERAGAILHRCAPTIDAREAACARVQSDTGATVVHPYTDPRVIAGQGTAERYHQRIEVRMRGQQFERGGGGLAAGTALAMQALAPGCRLYLAEPAGADDGARSFARGMLDHAFTPDTVCDGLRGTLGAPNFALLQAAGAEVLTVDDDATLAALRLVASHMKQLVEPSSAIVLAAVLAYRARFAGRKVGLVLSGGNLDLDALPALLPTATQGPPT